MIFVTSDLHFNHNKDFIYESRGFSSIQEHDEEIIKRWNQVVHPEDEVYFLGDIGMGGNINYIVDCVNQLNGTIHWIFGNHDTLNRIQAVSALPHIIIEGHAAVIKVDGQRFYLSHYPVMSAPIGEKPYNKSLISLCGHTHTDDPFTDWAKNYKECGSCNVNPGYMIYHCELDAHNCYPVSLEQLLEHIKNYNDTHPF